MREDSLLLNHDIAIVDEVHERYTNTDLILALLKNARAQRKIQNHRPLKIIATSATLDAEKFRGYLNNAPVIKVETASRFTVADFWNSRDESLQEAPAQAAQICVSEILKKEPQGGDVLIFMPGKEEIKETENALLAEFAKNSISPASLEIRRLNAASSDKDKEELKTNTSGKRRIIVATNVAETSVTIPVDYVIDSGFIKQTTIDKITGLEFLDTIQHSQSGCLQRRGRTGRIKEGKCYHLYTKDNFQQRPQYQTPEIQRSDVAGAVLAVKNLGLNIEDLDLLDKPNNREIQNATRTLQILGALDGNGNITPDIGREMADTPIDPHLSRMLIEARRLNCSEDVCTITAVVSFYQDLFINVNSADLAVLLAPYKNSESDFLTMLNIYRTYEENRNKPEWVKKMHLNISTLTKINILRREMAEQFAKEPSVSNPEAVKHCVSIGFADKIMETTGNGRYRLIAQPNISPVTLSRNSGIPGMSRYIIASDIHRNKKAGIIFADNCQVIGEKDLPLIENIKRILGLAKAELEKPPKAKPANVKETPHTPLKPLYKPENLSASSLSDSLHALESSKGLLVPSREPTRPGILRRVINIVKSMLKYLNPLIYLRFLASLWPFGKKTK